MSPVPDEGMFDPQMTPYGSILRADDGTYWYACGTWRLRDVPAGIPGILAYAPIGGRFPVHEGQKTLNVSGTNLAKISNQPLGVYQTVYLPAVADLLGGPRFGRLVLLQESRVVENRNPRPCAQSFVAGLPHEGAIVRDLCRRLEVALEDIGVWGSTLMFARPVVRHELDLVIYGRAQSTHAFECLVNGAGGDKLVLDGVLGPCAPFRFDGLVVDLFFDPGDAERPCLDGASIRPITKLRNQTISIEDDTDALFYPAIYRTSTLRLLSFRPAHARRFFRRGNRIRFDEISLIEVTWRSGSRENAFGVLDYERAERL